MVLYLRISVMTNNAFDDSNFVASGGTLYKQFTSNTSTPAYLL